MKIKYILVYNKPSKYFGMVKEYIKVFTNFEEMLEFRTINNIKNYELYKQIA